MLTTDNAICCNLLISIQQEEAAQLQAMLYSAMIKNCLLSFANGNFLWREGYILFSLLVGNVNGLVETVKTTRIKILRKFLY